MDTNQRVAKAEGIIKRAEMDLGALSYGQKSDLLLDNMPEVVDSEHAKRLIDLISINSH